MIVMNCVCDLLCFEDDFKDCCIDFFLDFNMDFLVFKYLQINLKQSFLIILLCNINNMFIDECFNFLDDFMGIFFVIDLLEKLYYRNIYCYFCNINNFLNFNLILLWNMIIKSLKLLDIQFYILIMDVLDFVFCKEYEIIFVFYIIFW